MHWHHRGRSAVIGVAAVVALIGGAGSASAGSASGGWGTYTVSGINYKNLAIIDTIYYPAAWAETDVVPINSAVGSDIVAANARILNTAGQVVLESGFQTNPGTIAAGGFFAAYTNQYQHAGSFSTQGVTKAWNGSVYLAYFTLPSKLVSTSE